jgi:dolichol-phosphate mannosyltransferase
MTNRTLVLIPTYNERDNVEWLFQGLQSLKLPFDILFVDDNSPDGTGKLLDELASQHPQVKVLHREGKAGIGSAHKFGIKYSYEQNYELLITMDADLTHSPKDIPKLLAQAEKYDAVVGSRYMQENSLEGWNLLRKFLTKTGNFLTTYLLGLKQDATGAFRLYRLDVLPSELFESIQSDGYSFFFESLHLIHQSRFKINEVPISLPPRTYGSSKMSYRDAFKSLTVLFSLFFQGLFRRKQFSPKQKSVTGGI